MMRRASLSEGPTEIGRDVPYFALPFTDARGVTMSPGDADPKSCPVRQRVIRARLPDDARVELVPDRCLIADLVNPPLVLDAQILSYFNRYQVGYLVAESDTELLVYAFTAPPVALDALPILGVGTLVLRAPGVLQPQLEWVEGSPIETRCDGQVPDEEIRVGIVVIERVVR